MTPKEKATEMVRKQFDIIAKASNYKGLKAEGEKKFYAIEKIAKQCATIGVDSIIELYKKEWNIDNSYWKEVNEEIAKL